MLRAFDIKCLVLYNQRTVESVSRLWGESVVVQPRESANARKAKLERWRRFGVLVRVRRLERGLGLRELAGKVSMSPAYLSKIENGEYAPPAEKKLRAMAVELDISADILFAATYRVSRDVRKIICRYPVAWTEFIRAARTLKDSEIRNLTAELRRRGQ